MTIKENKPIRGLIICMILFAAFWSYCVIRSLGTSRNPVWFILAFLFAEGYLLYGIAYNSRTFYVGKRGIFVTWFGKKTVFFGWAGFKVVQKQLIISAGNQHSKRYDAIVCSKIPLKMSSIYLNGGARSYVSAQWISKHPKEVIEIDLEFLEEGQYEEFWTYVPDELKHSS